jgi:predicted  nucleic acid-binding Zn-ribbon protein
MSSEKQLRDLQLQAQKLGSIEKKYSELQVEYHQKIGASQKTEQKLRDQLDREVKEKQRVEYKVAEMDQQMHGVKQSNEALERNIKDMKIQVSFTIVAI